MSHINEEDLILHYYGEGGRRRARLDAHLRQCTSCAAAYRNLASTLALIREPDIPERGDQYGLEVWQRIRHRLPDRESQGWLGWFGRLPLAWATAAAVLLVAAFAAGRYWPREPTAPSAVTVKAVGPDARDRILLTAVADHLDRSGRVLSDIVNSPAPGDIRTEQRWAEDLLTTSRLYRQDAIDAGERSVASVLDELERSLLEIVHSPSEISAADLEQIRRRVDAAALLFKVRVMSEELRHREETARPRRPTI